MEYSSLDRGCNLPEEEGEPRAWPSGGTGERFQSELNAPVRARKLRGDFTYHVYLGEDASMVAFYPVCPECSRIRQTGTVVEKEKLFERCGQSIYLEYFNWLFG